jgi:hypothetical protein
LSTIFNLQNVESLLLRDKFKILEGICTEYIFIEDIMIKNGAYKNYSTGWWAVPNPRKYGDYLLFKVSNNDPTENDHKIFRHFTKNGTQAYFVLYYNKELWVLDMNNYYDNLFKNKELPSYKKIWDFLKDNNYYHQNRPPLLANKEVRNEERQKRCIEFLKRKGVLHDVALQRYFANYILTVYFKFPINIDGFYVKDNQIRLYEIKYKYPAANGCYGLNKGFVKLFKWIIKNNIDIYHFVLHNGTRDENITVLDAIENESIQDKCEWRLCQINTDKLNTDESLAPSKTQIEGEREQKVIYIPQNDFKTLKTLFS